MGVLEVAKKLAAGFGLHVARLSNQPWQTVLGLTHCPIDLILDVGANEGQFARQIRERFPGAHIVSFEPLPVAFAKLQEWANADRNATALNIGLGDADTVLKMHHHVDHSPSSSFLAVTAEELELFPRTARQEVIEVPVKRLDDVLRDIGRPPNATTFLKLDVQGFEERVLLGAPRTLANVGALMLEVCLDPLYDGQADFFKLADLAREAGLRYAGNYSQALGRDGHVVFLDAMFRR